MFVLSCSGTLLAQKSDTLRVYFETAKSTMSTGIQRQVSGYIFNDIIREGQPLQIVGYADYVGGNQYNDKLSQARAKTVKKFLIAQGFSEKDITICIGKGEVDRGNVSGNEGFIRDRRVDIVTNPAAPAVEQAISPQQPVISQKPVPVVKKEQPVQPAPRGGLNTIKPSLENITTLKKDQTLVLDKLYFYAGRHVIKPESEHVLLDLYNILKKNEDIRVQIEGHVCCVNGSVSDALDFDTHEIALSVNRAKMVYLYLIKKGIEETRLSFRGFGATRRIAPEFSEEEADKNRRVEIRIL